MSGSNRGSTKCTWTWEHRTGSSGNGRHTNNTQRRLPIVASSLSSVDCPVLESCAPPPPTCMFFMWLLLVGHCWIGERLLRYNRQDSDACTFCVQAVKSTHHLAGIGSCTTSPGSRVPDWWILQRKIIGKEHCKGFDLMVVLICWLLWKERNARVFNNASMSVAELADWIRQVGR
jgi:hypothetical protein